ncbi:MAG TPA: hypothetical protein VFJ43_05070, partial [Bacteroidia bacterium]|nr:hypothetical protein [Bacteroidia bacterium]
DSKNFETHFDKHHQEISIYKIEEDTVIIRDLGETKHKLDFSENENPLIEFRKLEPALAKQIHWEDYDLSQ